MTAWWRRVIRLLFSLWFKAPPLNVKHGFIFIVDPILSAYLSYISWSLLLVVLRNKFLLMEWLCTVLYLVTLFFKHSFTNLGLMRHCFIKRPAHVEAHTLDATISLGKLMIFRYRTLAWWIYVSLARCTLQIVICFRRSIIIVQRSHADHFFRIVEDWILFIRGIVLRRRYFLICCEFMNVSWNVHWSKM